MSASGLDLAPFRQDFLDYVAGFVTGDAEFDENIAIKRGHSLRVADFSARIADSLDLAPDLDAACRLAGLFHDVGRFIQYRDHRSFDDRSTVDHGRLGARILGCEPFLDRAAPGVRRLVRAGVMLHNRRILPAAAPAPHLAVARVVRDADKLDIFPVMLGQFSAAGSLNPVATLGLRDEPAAWSEPVLAALRRRRLADYADMAFVNDFKLLLLTWVYDLNHPAARRMLAESGHLERLAGMLPPVPALREAAGQVLADL